MRKPRILNTGYRYVIIEYKGDNDPLDVVEIGNSKFGTGAVVQVRVLGALCLIDQGELDWKILVVNN